MGRVLRYLRYMPKHLVSSTIPRSVRRYIQTMSSVSRYFLQPLPDVLWFPCHPHLLVADNMPFTD